MTLQKLLGHSTLAMTLRYAHLARDFVAVEVNRMSFVEKIAGVERIEEEAQRQGAVRRKA